MIVCPLKDIGRYAPVIPGFDEALQTLSALTDWTPRTVPLSGGNKILVQQNTTKPIGTGEAHREYLDIQYIHKGKEVVGWADLAACTPTEDFNTEKDVGFYTGDFEYLTVNEGMCYVVFPEDVHMPGRHLDVPSDVVKAVVKLKV